MKYYCIIILLITACGAGSSPEQGHGSNRELEKSSPVLVNWSHEYLMLRDYEDWAYYDDHENFISKYFSVEYNKNHIVAKTLIEVNCIDSIIGKIEVSNDTIFLKSEIIITDDRTCSELHKFTFHISNPENIKYKIVSTK